MSNKKIISIRELSFFYKQKEVFNNLSLDIEKDSWTTIIGNNGSGKTTLAQLLIGNLTYTGQILINNSDAKKNKNNQIKLISTDLLKNGDINIDLKNEQTQKLIDEMGIKRLIQKNFIDLNNSEKTLIYLIKILTENPKIILLDNILDEIEYKYKNKIIKVLIKQQKQGTTIVNLSQNMEDILLGDDVIIIGNGKVELSGNILDIISDENKIKKLGLNLPFVIDLSNKLKYYGMVDKLYFNEKELIDAIWK